MITPPPLARLVGDLPSTVPFVGPEALERQTGHPLTLRLGANESTFGISPLARDAMGAALQRVACYGDPEVYELRAALADCLGVTMGHLVVGSGIDDLLGLAVRAFLDPGDPVVASLGSYPTFAYHVAGYGGLLHPVPYLGDRNDLQGLAEMAHRVGARIVYLANPDNPSGSWHSASNLLSFIDALPPASLLLLDEAYGEFAPTGTLPDLHTHDPRVIRLRTFSKAHGLAGARVGYAIAAPAIIAAFDKLRLHFGVNSIAQAGARASLSDPQFVRGVVDAVAEGRHDYQDLARDLGLVALPSATNFVAIDMGSARQARETVAALLRRGVFVRKPGAPPLDRCIRITVGTPDQRAAFAAIFRDLRS